MQFVDMSEFMPHLLHQAPGLTQYRITEILRATAQDYCKRTLRSREQNGPYSVLVGDGIIPLDTPGSQVKPWMVVAVTYKGKPVDPVTLEQLEASGADWRSLLGTPSCYVQLDDGSIQLVPAPASAETDAVWVTTSYLPADDADQVDSVLSDHHKRALIDGTLAEIFDMPNQPWTSFSAAARRRALYDAAVNAAIALQNRGNTNQALRADARRVVR